MIVLAVRSWDQDAAPLAPRLQTYRKAGCLVVVLGSRAGSPQDLAADFLLDNGAPSGDAVYGPAIAWFPNRMAPVSGLNALLVLRILDEEIASRIDK